MWSSVIGGSTFWKHAVLKQWTHERERELRQRKTEKKSKLCDYGWNSTQIRERGRSQTAHCRNWNWWVNHVHCFFNSLSFDHSKSNKFFTGPNVVVFLHGFPEIWYSWRHQMIALAGAGFRAIAPDYRGYGLSDQPPEPEKTTFNHLLSDLLAILDALSLSKVHCSLSLYFLQPW